MMRPELAIEKLQGLKDEARTVAAGRESDRLLWRTNIAEVIRRSLGIGHPLAERVEKLRAQSVADRVSGVAALADAAIYALELAAEVDEPIDESSFDPELWAHVRGLVESGDWGKVATQAAVFTEDKVRTWSAQDASVVGKGLYANALGDAGELRLGALKSEWEGWRGLGMGFAQAIGNVDRHQVQSRADIRRYAVGALGLASLLLTQMRYTHPEVIEERDPGSN